MNNEMDFEFELKRCFDEEVPELPEELKKENVIAMLEKDKLQPKKKKKHIFPKVLATAAALFIVVSSIYIIPVIMPESGLIDATTANQITTETENTEKEPEFKVIDNGLTATKLLQAQTAEDLKAHFVKIYRENKLDDLFEGFYDLYGTATDVVFNGAVSTDDAAPESAVPGMSQAVATTQAAVTQAAPQLNDDNKGYGETAADSYGQTNTQVENVDEADIIKNDGRYLYILSSGIYNVKKAVSVVDTRDMKVASRLEVNEEGYKHNVQEMYVNGDRLILIADEYEIVENELADGSVNKGYRYYDGKTVSFVYDISDRESPRLVRKVSQNGSRYISSRMIDGVLYTVSSYSVRGNSEDEVKANAVPEVNGEYISCDCIYVYDYDSDSYVVLTAYDTKLNDGKVNSLSILGSGDDVYCSRDALYVACANYDHENGTGSYSDIYAFSLNGAEIAYKASGTVKGDFLNQFSFDEYEGNLRVATTYYSYKHDVDVSSIYVLNKNLELIGALEDIAYDEQVKSVRFMGDTGYIVTFRNTDPLFTLDLSDPTAPKLIGEVKLPGFSSYLHPVGDGLVVGLGYDGDDENADFSSLKVSLFDVSDLKNPKEVDTFVLKNATSTALYNHKAFIYYPEENLIGFPVEHYENGSVFSYKLLKIENRVIESHLGYVHRTDRSTGMLFRGTYIGDKLYTVDSYNVCEFDIATAALLRECEILALEDDMPDESIYGDAVTTPAVMPGGLVETTVATTLSEDDINKQTTIVAYNNDAEVLTSAGYNPNATSTTVVVTEATTVPTTNVAEYSFEAKLVELYDESGALLVEVTEPGSSGLSAGTQAYLLSTGTEAYEKGDTLKIIFDGIVEETYPVRIPNVYGIGVSKR